MVGKPNVGKSTFFSATTLATVDIASYPFTTIKPNRGIAYLRTPCVCKEFDVQDNPINSICLDGVRLIPVELIDTAGLVPEAWKGRGLGNQFLDEIRKANALIHVVDISGSTDLEGRIVKPGIHNPIEDVRFLEREITMWLAQIIKRNWSRIARTVSSGKNNLQTLLEERLSGLSITRSHISKAIRNTQLHSDKPEKWADSDFMRFVQSLRAISKPMLIAANKIDLNSAKENLERLKTSEESVVPCSAEAELALRRAAEKGLIVYKPGDPNFQLVTSTSLTEQQNKALQTINKKILEPYGTTGVQKAVNNAFFNLLNMIVVYTVEDSDKLTDHNGRVLPDARLVPKGTTMRELAYMVHTELGKTFIHSIDVRTRMRRGEKYILKNGDIVSIVSALRRA